MKQIRMNTTVVIMNRSEEFNNSHSHNVHITNLTSGGNVTHTNNEFTPSETDLPVVQDSPLNNSQTLEKVTNKSSSSQKDFNISVSAPSINSNLQPKTEPLIQLVNTKVPSQLDQREQSIQNLSTIVNHPESSPHITHVYTSDSVIKHNITISASSNDSNIDLSNQTNLNEIDEDEINEVLNVTKPQKIKSKKAKKKISSLTKKEETKRNDTSTTPKDKLNNTISNKSTNSTKKNSFTEKIEDYENLELNIYKRIINITLSLIVIGLLMGVLLGLILVMYLNTKNK
jgi:hypothetical protein